MKIFFALPLCWLGLSVLASANRVLELSNDQGQKMRAELVLLEDGRVTLKRAGGQELTTSVDKFSEDSQELLRSEWKKKLGESAEVVKKFNDALGHKLFPSSGDLWSEPAADLARRMKWPKESKTPYTSSYRLYTRKGYKFAGAHPRTVVAYGDDQGKTESISLIYSNKGDSLSNVGSGEDHFEENGKPIDRSTLEGAMRHDQLTISKTLTEAFGEGTFQRVMAQGNSTVKVERWDWNGVAFLLALAKDEYVSLRIVKTSLADNKGKAERISDGDMRVRLKSNLVTKPNGDVYIDHIPMVDQGPKGYCAPATFERAMRHAGVAADMYLLATLATEEGGGTNTQRLFEEVAFTTRSKGGRTARAIELRSVEPKRVKKYIDKGVPILWSMCSLKGYNSIANGRTQKRKQVSSWTEYAEKIASAAEKNAEKLTDRSNFHICMIIGYNEATGELAVSDSWGNRYTRRWIHHLEAGAVSTGRCYVIDL